MKFADLITDKSGRLDRPYIIESLVFLWMLAEFSIQMWERKVSEWFTGLFVGVFVMRGAYSAWNNQRAQQLRKTDPVIELPPK